MSENYVLYHANCMDGFAAAWVAWKYFGSAIELLPVNYQEPFPDIWGDKLFILDFSYSREVFYEEILRRFDWCQILDHHKTAQKELKGISEARFDMTKSGAILAWEYFYPLDPPPLLLEYIQDRDLWQWKLPHSKQVNAALYVLVKKGDFQSFDLLINSPNPIPTLINAGEIVLATQNKYVELAVTNSFLSVVGGYEVPTVNSTILQSEIGEALCLAHPDRPFSAIFFDKDLHTRIFSLRSRGDFDVSEVAKVHLGGGHAQAAGFKISI